MGDANETLNNTINLLSKIDLQPDSTQKNEYTNTTIDFNMYLKMFIHELRTPLSTISMGLSLLENNYKNKTDKQTIHNLKQSVIFIENIFSKFAIIQNGNIELNIFDVFSLQDILQDVKYHLHYYLEETDVLFDYTIDPEIYDWNYGDKYNINHCIINLLKNAIKYRNLSRQSHIEITVKKLTDNVGSMRSVSFDEMSPSNIIPHSPPDVSPKNCIHIVHPGRNIKMSSTPPPVSNVLEQQQESKHVQKICISIVDNNEHILPNIKEHLFESFNTTSGSGLGLYICKNIIELHGGTVTHNFIYPIGNRFDITLSLDLCENTILHISTNNHEYYSPNNSKSIIDVDVLPNTTTPTIKPNTLLIDDSILNCKMMYRTLKQLNIFGNIYTGIDGNDAIQKIKTIQQKIDVIFLDKNMPGMDGIAVANKLRQLNYNKLIIGITGDGDPVEQQRFLESGVDYIIIKPLNSAKIKLIVDFLATFGTMRPINKKIYCINGVLTWV